jgi:hypothetical protein
MQFLGHVRSCAVMPVISRKKKLFIFLGRKNVFSKKNNLFSRPLSGTRQTEVSEKQFCFEKRCRMGSQSQNMLPNAL